MPPNLSCTTPLESRDQQQTIHSGIKVPSENGKKLAKPNPVHTKRNGMAFNSPRTRNRLHARVCHPLFILGISRVKRHFTHDCSIGYRWNDKEKVATRKQGFAHCASIFIIPTESSSNGLARLVVYTCSPRLSFLESRPSITTPTRVLTRQPA